jgi:hypothetical protein
VTSPTLATIVMLRADRSPAGQRTPARRYAALRVPDQVVYVATVYGAADARTADQIIRSIRSGLGQSGRSG